MENWTECGFTTMVACNITAWAQVYFTLIIDNVGKLSTTLHDKLDDFDFHIVNFPFFPATYLALLMVYIYRS